MESGLTTVISTSFNEHQLDFPRSSGIAAFPVQFGQLLHLSSLFRAMGDSLVGGGRVWGQFDHVFFLFRVLFRQLVIADHLDADPDPILPFVPQFLVEQHPTAAVGPVERHIQL